VVADEAVAVGIFPTEETPDSRQPGYFGQPKAILPKGKIDGKCHRNGNRQRSCLWAGCGQGWNSAVRAHYLVSREARWTNPIRSKVK